MNTISHKPLFILLVSSLLLSCATPSRLIRQRLDPWIGQDISALILKWGAPNLVYELPNGNGSIYKWEYYSQQVNNVTMMSFGNLSYGYSTPNQTFCKFEWITNEYDIIQSYQWSGRCKVK